MSYPEDSYKDGRDDYSRYGRQYNRPSDDYDCERAYVNGWNRERSAEEERRQRCEAEEQQESEHLKSLEPEPEEPPIEF